MTEAHDSAKLALQLQLGGTEGRLRCSVCLQVVSRDLYSSFNQLRAEKCRVCMSCQTLHRRKLYRKAKRAFPEPEDAPEGYSMFDAIRYSGSVLGGADRRTLTGAGCSTRNGSDVLCAALQ
jgi:hypothetical protein